MLLYTVNILLATGAKMVENTLNKTSQAYPVACCRDAQTGGFLFLWPRGCDL